MIHGELKNVSETWSEVCPCGVGYAEKGYGGVGCGGVGWWCVWATWGGVGCGVVGCGGVCWGWVRSTEVGGLGGGFKAAICV